MKQNDLAISCKIVKFNDDRSRRLDRYIVVHPADHPNYHILIPRDLLDTVMDGQKQTNLESLS